MFSGGSRRRFEVTCHLILEIIRVRASFFLTLASRFMSGMESSLCWHESIR